MSLYAQEAEWDMVLLFSPEIFTVTQQDSTQVPVVK